MTVRERLAALGAALRSAALGLRETFGIRELQFYSGVALVGVSFGWGIAGAVLATHAVFGPLIARLGGRS